MPAEPSGKSSRRPVRIGKYEVLAHIASGGMGTVYKAIDTDLGREVALKVLTPQMAARPAMLERFRREARSAAKLRHENIVAIYEFSEANGTYFLALEYVDGMDLHEFISRHGKLKPALARQILIQAARALAHAHQEGIVHRDVKPSNFLITEKNGKLLVKLADLGLAREASDDEFRLTRDGATVGTIDYMSPEQARNSASADIRSDLYSLGCTFYHMLAGNCPFPEGSLTERIYKHVEAAPPDVRRLIPEVPAGLVAILKRLLKKKPEDRYQTPDELLDDLEVPQVLADPAPEPPEPAPEPVAARPARPPPSTAAQTQVLPARADSAVTEAPAAPLARPRLAPKKPPREAPERIDELASAAKTEKKASKNLVAKTVRRRTAAGRLPWWWSWAAGAAGLVLTAVSVVLVVSSSERPGDTGPTAERTGKDGEAGGRNGRDGPGAQDRKGEPVEKGSAGRELSPAELARLRATFEGPASEFPAPPPDAPVLRVSRSATPGPNSFRSLAETWKAAVAGRHTIIEIRDNGPLFEPAMPPAVGRSLTVRAAPGYRPLIAWERAADDRFLTVEKGSLTLENLDVVMKGTEERPARPAVLAAIAGGNLAARACTFSVASKHTSGVEIVRLDPQGEPARCRLSRCLVRGAGLTALSVRGAGADVLLDGCLVVSAGDGPLLDVQMREDGTCTLRLVRSTLVAGKAMLQVASSPAGKAGRPAVRCLCWDAVLTRAGPKVEGDMVRVAGAASIGRMSWKAAGAVYAGWEKLLATADRDIAPAEEETWRRTWGKGAGGRVLAEPWPASLPAGLEESGPAAFDLRNYPAFPAASAGAGPVGCDLAALPVGRSAWLGLTYERFFTRSVSLPAEEAAPKIPNRKDRFYHGGRVQLDAKTPDLGKFLRDQLQNQEPGPRVVLHVSGSGTFETSPIQLSGADLVLYFDRPGPQAKPLWLSPNQKTTRGKAALIEVEGGSLEMTGARVRFENSARAKMPLRLLRVQGGRLRLFDCHLQGPLTRPPPEYLGAIQFEGSGKEEPGHAHECALNQCVLLSARSLLTVRGTGARLLLNQCALLALGDALRFEPGEAPAAGRNVTCTLKRDTVAVRRAVVYVGDAPRAPAGAQPAVVQADDCLFLDPFADQPSRGSMLVYEGDALARGLLLWQGKNNAYDDKRLQVYAASEAEAMPARQTHATWAQLWGKAGEQQPHFVPWPATALWTIDPDRPQLERLRLPPMLQLPVGANLFRLGITKTR